MEGASRLSSDSRTKTLLLIGPLPPPIGGVTVTFQIFLKEIAKDDSILAVVINTSPPAYDYSKKRILLGPETLQRSFSVMKQYLSQIETSDAVLVFATNTFMWTLGAMLLLPAIRHGTPLYFRPFGALDLRLASRKRPIRIYMSQILRRLSGVFVETKQIRAALKESGCVNIHYVPGYRPMPEIPPQRFKNSSCLRLIFLSHIRREKGPLVLLEALRLLAREGGLPRITCDFFGPIFDDDRDEFLQQLEMTPGSQYHGVVEAGTGSRLIATYDALVLPTYFMDEGQSGTIIEAMQAGVPIISTRFRAIPELIVHGENGLLVPTKDSRALAGAIKRIALDPALRKRMGEAGCRRGQAFRADVAVSQILGVIFPQ